MSPPGSFALAKRLSILNSIAALVRNQIPRDGMVADHHNTGVIFACRAASGKLDFGHESSSILPSRSRRRHCVDGRNPPTLANGRSRSLRKGNPSRTGAYEIASFCLGNPPNLADHDTSRVRKFTPSQWFARQSRTTKLPDLSAHRHTPRAVLRSWTPPWRPRGRSRTRCCPCHMR